MIILQQRTINLESEKSRGLYEKFFSLLSKATPRLQYLLLAFM